MDTAALKAAAMETLYLIAQATDELDIKLLEGLFIPSRPVTVDVSGHLGYPPQDVLPSQLAQLLIKSISGFTATHHVITNPVVTLEATGGKARVVAYKTAYHCIQTEGEIKSATARGKWDIEMEQLEGRWKVTSFTVLRTVPLLEEELGLWDVAKSRVADGQGREAKS